MIDTKTGAVTSDFVGVSDYAYVVASAGSRGWYLVDFKGVRGEEQLEHLRMDRTIDTAFAPRLPVPGLACVVDHGGVVYASGDFGVVAFDAKNGRRLWRVGTKGDPVLDLGYWRGRLYVSGNFNHIGARDLRGIAILRAADGHLVSNQLRLGFNGGGPHTVATSAINDGVLYLVGWFSQIDGAKRDGLAAVNLRSGTPTAWAPMHKTIQPYFNTGDIATMLVSHGQVLLGNSNEEGGFAVLDAKTGRYLPWARGLKGDASAFAASGKTVYIGGRGGYGFKRAGGKPANNLVSVILPEGRFTNWRPDLGPCTWISAIAVSGHKLLVSGNFETTGDCPG